MLPEQMKHVRKHLLGISQTALANALDMSRSSVARMESGEQEIELRTELALRWVAWRDQNATWTEEQREMDL